MFTLNVYPAPSPRAPVPGSPGRSTDNARHIAPPSHHRPNWRQINFVVQIVQHLIGIGQRSSAMHTAQRLGHDCRIGVAGQRPAATLPAQATLARAFLPFLRRLGFSPFDGGRLELFGVFGGSASFASNSAMRRSASSSRCHSAGSTCPWRGSVE